MSFIERQKERFKNHVATFTDYGNIKILDFKAPNTNEYRIRFLFEEDYCRLHISGDLGELIASNYNNMTYEKFSDFVNNTGYFEEKIDCMSRRIYRNDEEKAKEDILKLISEYKLADKIVSKKCQFETDDEAIVRFLEDALCDYDTEKGMGQCGYDLLDEFITYDVIGEIGKKNTNILDLYMLAFKLAKEQIDNQMA